MQDISQRGNQLYFEDLSLQDIAQRYGTPTFVYSRAAIARAFRAYQEALGDHPGKICYAVKANSNLAVLQVLAQLGASFDIVSGGELERVLHAGGRPDDIIFSGVGKSAAEMRRALDVGIACFNVESVAELHKLSETAQAMGKIAKISLRVNPDVDANTHPYISTGLKENKFGIDIAHAPAVYKTAMELPGIRIVGVDCHIGSQLVDKTPFIDALERLLTLVDQLGAMGIAIQHLDLGGGLGIRYRNEAPPSVAEYIAQIKGLIGARPLHLVFEPGRSIVGNAGVLLTEVMYLKPGDEKNFAIVDAAMNDNIRPALYQSWQDIRAVNCDAQKREEKTWDIVGPICETSDFLAKERTLALAPGDLLAMMSSGAYCFSMASNYNTRTRAAEILIDGEQSFVVRERETFDDLIRGEHLLPNESL